MTDQCGHNVMGLFPTYVFFSLTCSSLTAIAMPTYQQFDISLVMYSTVRDILWVA